MEVTPGYWNWLWVNRTCGLKCVWEMNGDKKRGPQKDRAFQVSYQISKFRSIFNSGYALNQTSETSKDHEVRVCPLNAIWNCSRSLKEVLDLDRQTACRHEEKARDPGVLAGSWRSGRSINRRTINALLFSRYFSEGHRPCVPPFAFLRSMCAEDGTPCGTGSHVWDHDRVEGDKEDVSSNKNTAVRQYLRNVNTLSRGWWWWMEGFGWKLGENSTTIPLERWGHRCPGELSPEGIG